MTANSTGPPLPRRMLALAGYLGLAPWLGFLPSFREDPFLRHHRAQALVVFLGLAPLLLLGLASLLVMTEIFTDESWLFDFDLIDVTRATGSGFALAEGLVAAGWALVWVIAVGLALAGSVRRAPYVRGTGTRWVQGLAVLWSGFLGLAAAFLLVFGLYASHLARSGEGPAPVYFLFDPRGFEGFGSWGPKMAFFPISREANARWGEGSVVVAPFDSRSFRQAIERGRFVVLFVHGTEGAIQSAGMRIEPPPAWQKPAGRYLNVRDLQDGGSEIVPAGADLQLLYITGCRTGARGLGWVWQKGLAPTKVITFDRMTGGLEHLWWLWTEAPRRLKTIR